MATPGALQAQLAQARSPEEYVDMLQHGVTHFPRTALFWRLYAEHERSLSGPASGLAVLEGGGSSALPWCRCDPELWRVACELRRDCGRREDELGPESRALGRALASARRRRWRGARPWRRSGAATWTAPKKSTATDLLPAETKAAALHYACGRRRVAAAYRAACDANAGRRAGLFLEDCAASKKLSAKIYEAHAALELSMNGDVDAARRTFELGLSQRPELLLANDATHASRRTPFLESAGGRREAAAAVVERAVAAKGERDAPPALWDALASLAHRNATARASGARRRRREAAPPRAKHAVGGALAPLWRDVASTRAAPLNAVDTAWRVREPCRRRCPDLAACATRAGFEAAGRRRLADEYDNGGLDADDLADDGGEGDGLFAALARGKLPGAAGGWRTSRTARQRGRQRAAVEGREVPGRRQAEVARR
ncbi:hypothetical protein SO694_00004459 [Aureococcus anophagefferens]|uniref:Suppressor of forked domain-containing protein n=1 Tax=Aureococcus anophagefferens TaxID=44056 RepID=A0ABR1G9Q5_AURAN